MKLVHAINKNDINKFIEYFANSRSRFSERNLTMFEVGLTVGLRVSDLVRIKFRSVFDINGNLKQKIDPIVEQKTGKKNYYLFLNNERTRKQLVAYRHWLLDNGIYHKYLFPNSRNEQKPMLPNTWYHIIKRAAKAVGVNYDVGTHSLRKTFGMLQYRASNYDLVYVQKRLNHSKPSITERYLGLDKATIAEKAKKIGNTF